MATPPSQRCPCFSRSPYHGKTLFLSIPEAPFDKVATGSYILSMTTVSMKEAKNRLTQLARLVEKGETVVVTRNGKPAFDLVPHKPAVKDRFEALEAYKKKHGINRFFGPIPDDFDDPLPE